MTLGSADRLSEILQAVAATIDSRALNGDSETSYTAKLLKKGPAQTAKKLGEEAVELVIAVSAQSNDEVSAETADLLYHLLVALRSRGVSMDDVAAKLAEREGLSGLAEKASRGADET